jgi:Putative beta-barrel porin 2
MKNQLSLAFGGMAALAGATTVFAQQTSPLFQIGSVDVRPHASYSLVYDDNIFLDNKDKNVLGRGNAGRDHDFIHIFTPGLRVNAGDVGQRQSAYFDANYQIAISRFTDNSGADAHDQNASVELGGKLNRLSLAAKQTLTTQSDADVANLAANGRVRRKTWITNVDTDYEISDKTSASLDLAQTIGDYSGAFSDTADRSASLWLDYQFLPKVKAGVGGTVGYLQVDGNALNHNPNSAYYQGKLRLAWQASEKVTINANGGYEYRNIQDLAVSDPSMFVFGLDATWKAAERTSVRLGATRGRVASNALGSAINQQTAFTASLRQGLADNLSLNLEGGYSMAEYELTTRNAPAGVVGGIRDDNYAFVKPSLAYRFAERAQATVYYQYRRNDSTALANANDFYNNQLGIELSYRF